MQSLVNSLLSHLNAVMVLPIRELITPNLIIVTPGTAVTDIQMDGVLHEFSTIDGVVEDVAAII